jgi:hypothetical protein
MKTRTAAEWQAWLQEMSQHQNEEAWRGILCFFRWIEIRALNGHATPSFLEGLQQDLHHSALLRRLIAGKEPLPEPPPESFGQPWYELIENGEATASEVKPWEWDPESKLSINKGVWTIQERIGETEYLVTRKGSTGLYEVAQHAEQWVIRKRT